jgi:tetratricopeptide (TPR) repeat protein
VVDPLVEYYEGVKGLIRGRCGDGAVLVLSPPLTWAYKLVSELRSKFGEDRVRHYIIGSRSGRKEVEALRGILEEIRKGGGLASDGKLMSKLRALLGDNLVGGVKPDCIIPYYISWEEARRYASDERVNEKVRNALMLITNGFESRGRRITWFGLDYVPEELVEEAMSTKSEDVEGWVDAYLYIVSKLNLDGGFLHEVKMVFKRFIGFIETSLPVIGQATHVAPEPFTQMGAVALSFIESLAKDEVHAFRGIIDTVRHLKALRRGGDLNTLGKLIAYKLAVDMGISYEVVHNVLANFAGLADDVLRDIEERLDIIEIKSQSIEGAFRVYDKGGFERDSEAHPGILIINDELLIQGGVIGGSALETYRVVTTKGFNDLRDEVLKRLDDEGVAVLVGPRGIGKTTLATYVIWTLFRKGGLRFMVNVKDLEEVGTEFTGFISQYLARHWGEYGDLLVVYDPSTTKTYSLADKKTEAPKGISNTIDTLLGYIAEDEKVRGRVRLLVVLPTDIYQALPQDLKDRLGKYVLDLEERGFLKDPEFIAAVVMEYAKGCSIDYDKAKALANEILGKFSEGYTLIARLTGTLIASKHRCNIDDARRIIEGSRGNAHYFILRYINSLFRVYENPDTAETLVEIFALRRPFVDSARPGDPILTPGIIKLIGEGRGVKTLYGTEGGELRGWLARRQHDLIEESIEKLLKCIANESEECKELSDVLKPWNLIRVMKSSRRVSEVKDVSSAVKYFADNYGGKLTDTLRDFSNECWRRAALIIGAALAGYGSVPRPEDLPGDLVKSFGDALSGCGIDEYLLVGNEIPPLIQRLIKNHVHVLTKAFIDKYDRYDDIVNEVNNVLKNARDRGGISTAEGVYGLGLASIIANVAKPDKTIKPSDADVALRIASFAMKIIILADYVKPILHALKPLRDYAPQRYLGLLAFALEIGNLDRDTVRYIFKELNEILGNYGDVVEGHAWSLVHAIRAYADLLGKYRSYFNNEEVENVVGRVADLLNELGKFKTSLSVIAWAHALVPALWHEYVRVLMEMALHIDVVDKASEILEELSRLRGLVQELMGDKEFMGYVESMSVKADEEAVKIGIIDIASYLKHALAIYRFNNDELREAAELFNKAIEGYREISNYENYLANRSLALRVKAIEGSLVSDKLVDGFRQLYEETFNKEYFKSTAQYLSTASGILGDYLVSLALMGSDESVKRIKELFEERWWVLNADYEVSVLTRLMLNALLGSRVGLSDELKGKLNVDPKELIVAFEYGMVSEFLPALMVAFDVIKPEDGIKLCEGFIGDDCIDSVLAVKGNSAAIEKLRDRLIDTFRERISEEKRLNLLKGLGVNVDKLFNEFRGLVNGPDSNELDGKSLVQLLAPRTSTALLALMLYALVNGDKELDKAHALYGAVNVGEKLLTRLFLEAYRACCDLSNEGFRRAIAKLFFYHV